MKPKSTKPKPKPKFNRRKVFNGWVFPNDVPIVRYSNGDLKFMLFAEKECSMECPCRITVEWKEKK